MDVFEDADHLASWCGLTPRANESAGKKHSTSIMKAGAYLKPLLVQCALAAVKSKKQSYFAIKYNRLARRRGKKRAIIAIARMMVVCLYHMIKDKKSFSPSDYDELVNPCTPKQPKVVLNDANVFAYLQEQGYDISSLVKSDNN